MEQIKMEEIAPYLAHELKCYTRSYKANLTMDVGGSQGFTVCISDVIAGYAVPVLRPLEMLTQEIEHGGKRFVPIDYNAFKHDKESIIDFQNKFIHYHAVKFGIIDKLLSWHFDIFNLIPRGLAKAKTT